MGISLTSGTNSVSVLMVLGYNWSQPSRNIVHDVVGSDGPTITYRVPGSRTGTLELLCLTAADAASVVALHNGLNFITLVDTDVPLASMSYVVDGNVSTRLDPQTRTRWIVSIDFRQVFA